MKKILLIGFGLVICQMSHAQRVKLKSPTFMSLTFSSGMNGVATFRNQSLFSFDPIKFKEESEDIGFSIGANAIWELNKKNNLSIGLSATKLGFQLGLDSLFGHDPNDPLIPKAMYAKLQSYFVELPVLVSYKLSKQSNGLFIRTGLKPQFKFLNRSVNRLEYRDRTEERTFQRFPESNWFNLAYSLELGYEAEVNQDLIFQISPYFNTQVVRYFRGTFHRHLWSTGLQLSLVM